MRTALYLIIATALWGLNFHLAKVMLQYCPAMVAGFWRYLFAVIVLFAFTIKDLPSWGLIKKNLGSLAFAGIIGLFGFNFFFFYGLKYTTALNAALIVSLNPALAVLFSFVLLKTKISSTQIAGVVLAFVGVLFLTTKGNLSTLDQVVFSIGDLYIFMSNIVFSLYHVWVKKNSGKMETMHFTFITNVMCFLVFLLILPFQELDNFANYSYQFWIAAIGIGAFGTSLAYYLWNKGVGEIGAARAGIYMNIAPLSTVLFSLFFGEELFLYHIISFVIIVTGLLIMQLKPDFYKKAKKQ